MALLVGFGSSSSPPTNSKKNKKQLVEVGPPLTKLSGFAHVVFLKEFYENFNFENNH